VNIAVGTTVGTGAVPVTLTGLEPATSPIPGEQGRSIPLELQRHHDLHDRLWRRKGYEFTQPLLGRTEFPLSLAKLAFGAPVDAEALLAQ
jgi:hypothetical protein